MHTLAVGTSMFSFAISDCHKVFSLLFLVKMKIFFSHYLICSLVEAHYIFPVTGKFACVASHQCSVCSLKLVPIKYLIIFQLLHPGHGILTFWTWYSVLYSYLKLTRLYVLSTSFSFLVYKNEVLCSSICMHQTNKHSLIFDPYHRFDQFYIGCLLVDCLQQP